MSLAENLGVSVRVLYSIPGKPCGVIFERDSLGISCEFVIAAAAEISSTESSGVRSPSFPQMPSIDTQDRKEDAQPAGVTWGGERQISPAQSIRPPQTEDEEEGGFVGDGLQMDYDEEEEIPPTQQERYQGIFNWPDEESEVV